MSVVMMCERALGLARDNSLKELDSAALTMLESLNYSGLVDAHAQDEAVWCARFFAGTRDRLLEADPWVFARKSVAPARLASSLPGWSYSFALPSDCVKALSLVISDYGCRPATVEQWEQVGLVVGCAYDAVTLRYTARIENTDLWDPLYAETFCCSLAAKLCSGANGLESLCQSLEQQAMLNVLRARETGAVRVPVNVPIERYGWHGFQDRAEPRYLRRPDWGY